VTEIFLIKKEDNEPAKKIVKPNENIGRLFNLLFEMKAYGENVRSKQDIWKAFYEFEASGSQKNSHRSTIPIERNKNKYNYGHNRISNICNPNHLRRMSEAEMMLVYHYFINTFGKVWEDIISPKDLVEQKVSEVFRLGKQHNVAFPTAIANSDNLIHQANFCGVEPLNIKIEKATLRHIATEKFNPHSIVPLYPVHSKETLFSIDVHVKRKLPFNIFVFQFSKDQIVLDEDNNPVEIIPIRLTHMANEHVQIKRESPSIQDGGTYYSFAPDASGISTIYCIAFPIDKSFEELFGVDAGAKYWDSAESSLFTNNVKKCFRDFGNDFHFGYYRYSVI